MAGEPTTGQERPTRGWPRAAGLFGIVLATPVLHPAVLIAVPLLLLLPLGRSGLRRFGGGVAALVAVLIATSGSRDGIWFAERAWSILLGGWFAGLTMLVPSWTLSARALSAVLGAAAVAGGVLAARADAWATVDALITDSVRAGYEATLDGWALLSGGEALSPELLTNLQQAAEAQAAVFPALIFIESMAALGVVWWVRARLLGQGDGVLGRLSDFRFNDHLVWIFVTGLLLLVAQVGDAVGRVGSNAVVFMGALYAMRGAAVMLFVTGGMSFFGFAMVVLCLVLATPLVPAMAVAIGVGDTWLDLRSRARERAA